MGVGGQFMSGANGVNCPVFPTKRRKDEGYV